MSWTSQDGNGCHRTWRAMMSAKALPVGPPPTITVRRGGDASGTGRSTAGASQLLSVVGDGAIAPGVEEASLSSGWRGVIVGATVARCRPFPATPPRAERMLGRTDDAVV
jgi:hypothetical protein